MHAIFPAIKGPSYLSVHLRFGTVSIRLLAARPTPCMCRGIPGAMAWLNELIWRDFTTRFWPTTPAWWTRRSKTEIRRYPSEQGKHANLALFCGLVRGRTGFTRWWMRP